MWNPESSYYTAVRLPGVSSLISRIILYSVTNIPCHALAYGGIRVDGKDPQGNEFACMIRCVSAFILPKAMLCIAAFAYCFALLCLNLAAHGVPARTKVGYE